MTSSTRSATVRHAASNADLDPLAEIRNVRDTAERMANGENESDADQIRVLAGMLHLLAEQVERLLNPGQTSTATPAGDAASTDRGRERERALEEDLTPEDPPAQPADDRSR